MIMARETCKLIFVYEHIDIVVCISNYMNLSAICE